MGALKSPRRKKYACSECTTRSSTVAVAAIRACPSTWPPNTCGLPMSRLSPRNKSSSRRSSVITLIRSSSNRFMEASMRAGGRGGIAGDPQPLLHDRTGGGVLQELAFLGKQVVLDTERRESRFVKTAQDQFLLAGIGIDVSDGEDSRHAGLKFFGVDLERLAFQFKAPVGDRTQFRMQAEERQNLVRSHLERAPVVGLHNGTAECAVVG